MDRLKADHDNLDQRSTRARFAYRGRHARCQTFTNRVPLMFEVDPALEEALTAWRIRGGASVVPGLPARAATVTVRTRAG